MLLNKLFMLLILTGVNVVITRLLLKNLNYFLMSRGVYGFDVNKLEKNKVPEEGGVSITLSLIFTFAIFSYYFRYSGGLLLVVTTMLISLIGFIDHFRNIQPYPKFIYCAVIGSLYSISLIESQPSISYIYLYIIISVGFSYSFLVNAFNLLAGFNGLESGLTVIASLTLAIYFYINGYYNEAGIAVLTFSSYLVFWFLNKYPSRIFPGDSGTLVPASIFMGLSITSNTWYPMIFVMAPHIINVIIKFISTGISSRSDHEPLIYKDDILSLGPDAYLSLIRIFLLRGGKHEKQIVYTMYLIEIFFCALLFLVG